MLGVLGVVLAFRLPCVRQPVTARAAACVTMSGRQDADSYLKSTIEQASVSSDANDAMDDATRDPEPPAAPAPANMATRIDGRVDHPAERPPQPQAESDAVLATQPSAAQSQAALESGPPAGAVPVAYQESAYDRFVRSRNAAPPGSQATPPVGAPVLVPPAYGSQANPAANPNRWDSAPNPAAAMPVGEPALSTRAVRVLGPVALFAGAVAGTLAFTSVSNPATFNPQPLLTQP